MSSSRPVVIIWTLLLLTLVCADQDHDKDEFLGDDEGGLAVPLGDPPMPPQSNDFAPVLFSESDLQQDIEIPPFVDSNTDAPACTSEISDLALDHVMCLRDVGTELPLSVQDRSHVLDLHNDLRTKVIPPAADMFSLVWDDALAQLAGKAARQCNASLDLMESAALNTLPDFPGVYLAMNMAAGSESWDQAVNVWFQQRQIFEFGAGSLSEKSTLEYTNLVAGTTSRVGCGAARCANMEHGKNFVCFYASEFEDGKEAYPYEVGDWCSLCKTCTSDGKLCSCNGRVCLNGGRLDSKTCTCNCFDNFYGNSCESRRNGEN